MYVYKYRQNMPKTFESTEAHRDVFRKILDFISIAVPSQMKGDRFISSSPPQSHTYSNIPTSNLFFINKGCQLIMMQSKEVVIKTLDTGRVGRMSFMCYKIWSFALVPWIFSWHNEFCIFLKIVVGLCWTVQNKMKLTSQKGIIK